MMIAAVSALVYGLLLKSAQADKDDSYYIAGTGNPNKDETMYWKDAENIFQDLSQFETLYVEFNNCAWTWMMMSEEDNDVDENDYWYMGKIAPMGANVAYSLYGSLSGESFAGCNEDTFINSFYTNTGFTNFARAMDYAGQSGFSSYTYDDYSSSSYTASCGGGYGVGCDYSNGFAVHTYSGDECNPANYTGVQDKLSSLNSAMQSAQCVQIYDASSYSGSPYGTPLELLAYSHSCFYQDFFSPDGVCPDPYGKLSYYQQQFYNGIQESKKQDPYQVSKRKTLYNEEIRNGKVMTLAGVGLAALAFVIFFYDCVVSCFCKKEPRKQVHVPREDDFIVKKRNEADLENSDTDGEKSAISENSNYVTMSTETYSPPANIVMPPSTVTLPPQAVPAAPSPVPPPKVAAPTPQAAVPPTPVPPPQVATAPTAVTPPQAPAAVAATPTVIPPPPQAAAPTPVPPPIAASAVAAPAPVQPPQVGGAAAAAAAPAAVPSPQVDVSPSTVLPPEAVAAQAPPKAAVAPTVVVGVDIVSAASTIGSSPQATVAPGPNIAQTPDLSAPPGANWHANVAKGEPVSVYAPPCVVQKETVTKEIVADVKDKEVPPTPSQPAAAAKEESPKPEEPAHSPVKAAEVESPAQEASTAAPTETAVKETPVQSTVAPSVEKAESTSSPLTETPTPEEAVVMETPSLISIAEVEPTPLFAGICGSSSNLASSSSDNMPFNDESVASRSLSDDEEYDQEQGNSLPLEEEPPIIDNPHQRSAVSTYFSATEIEVATSGENESPHPTPTEETRESNTTTQATKEEPKTASSAASWFRLGVSK